MQFSFNICISLVYPYTKLDINCELRSACYSFLQDFLEASLQRKPPQLHLAFFASVIAATFCTFREQQDESIADYDLYKTFGKMSGL